MSEGSAPEERTEMPTAKRMQQLRRDGQIFLSTELVQVATMSTGFFILTLMVHRLFNHMQHLLVSIYKRIGASHELNYKEVESCVLEIMRYVAPDLVIIAGTIAVVAVLSVMLQTDWNIKEDKFKFDIMRMNPITGLKGLVSISGAISILKAIAKLSLILPVGYYGLKHFAPEMISLIHLDIPQVLAFTGTAMSTLFWKIFYILFALAIFDYYWGKFRWLKVNKMTKQEVKDERKSMEGDEETKRKIQLKGLQRIAQRIAMSVPTADVVVTNPTHFAVALKYDRATMVAPVVVAKGQDFIALRIREIAKENNIPVLERKVLARALYKSTEVGSEIPYELFKAVAEVLAYVFRLKNPNAYQHQSQGSR